MKTDIKNILIVVVLALVFTGCKLKKTAIQTTADTALGQKTQEDLFSDILDKSLKYQSISTKGSIEFRRGNSSKKMPAVCKLLKDSALQISIRIPLLGTEAMKINMTPESVTIIDRMTERYATERFEDIGFLKNIDLNYYNLQDLITNHLFVPGKKGIAPSDVSKYNLSATNNAYILNTKDRTGLSYNFAVNGADRIIATSITHEQENASMRWSYNDFVEERGYTYPQNMVASLEAMEKKIEVSITYTKADFNNGTEIDLSVPKRYKKVNIQDIISSYMNI